MSHPVVILLHPNGIFRQRIIKLIGF